MFIAKVQGNVVTTQKVEEMTGRKLLIVDPLLVSKDDKDMTSTGRTFVAVDSMGAGENDLVLVTQGSSARMTEGTAKAPVDCVIIGIIDSINAMGNAVYKKGTS